MTLQGGTAGNGVFYSLTVGLKQFVTYVPTYGRVGCHRSDSGARLHRGQHRFLEWRCLRHCYCRQSNVSAGDCAGRRDKRLDLP